MFDNFFGESLDTVKICQKEILNPDFYSTSEEFEKVKNSYQFFNDIFVYKTDQMKGEMKHWYMNKEISNEVFIQQFQQFELKPSNFTPIQDKLDSILKRETALEFKVDDSIDYRYEVYARIAHQITQKRPGLHSLVFGKFFLRILNNRIREIIWEDVLFNEVAIKNYLDFKRNGGFTNMSTKRVDIHQNIESMLKNEFQEIDPDPDINIALANVVMYHEYLRRKPFPENQYFLLPPLAMIFTLYRSEEKNINFIGFFDTLLRIQKFHTGKHVLPSNTYMYEAQLEEHIAIVLEILGIFKSNLKHKIKSLITVDETSATGGRFSNQSIRKSRGRVKMGEFIRGFCESFGAKLCNLELVLFIYDSVIIRSIHNELLSIEFLVGFSIILMILQEEILLCTTMDEFLNLIDVEIKHVAMYDYYLIYSKICRTHQLSKLDAEFRAKYSTLGPLVPVQEPPPLPDIQPDQAGFPLYPKTAKSPLSKKNPLKIQIPKNDPNPMPTPNNFALIEENKDPTQNVLPGGMNSHNPNTLSKKLVPGALQKAKDSQPSIFQQDFDKSEFILNSSHTHTNRSDNKIEGLVEVPVEEMIKKFRTVVPDLDSTNIDILLGYEDE